MKSNKRSFKFSKFSLKNGVKAISLKDMGKTEEGKTLDHSGMT